MLRILPVAIVLALQRMAQAWIELN